jgi:hypothetical protein
MGGSRTSKSGATTRVVLVSSVIAAIAALVAIPTAVFIWQNPKAPEVATTTTRVFAPKPADLLLGSAVCADRSATSIRSDARACVAGDIMHDPCFVTQGDQVHCPVGNNDAIVWSFKLVATVPAPDIMPKEGPIAIDDAVAKTFPWAVETEEGKWCQLSFWVGIPDEFQDKGSHTYVCESGTKGFIFDPPEQFFKQPRALKFDLDKPAIVLRALTRADNGGVWTAVSNTTGDRSQSTVRIRTVLY